MAAVSVKRSRVRVTERRDELREWNIELSAQFISCEIFRILLDLRSNMYILLTSRILNRHSECCQHWSSWPPQTMFVLLCSAEVTESLICGTGEKWGRGRGSHIVTGMLVTSHLGRNCMFRLIFLSRWVSLKVARKEYQIFIRIL